MTPKTLALSILLLAAACSSSSGSGDGDGGGDPGDGTGPATLSAYCDEYWTSFSIRWAACERGSAAMEAAVFASAPRCADALQAVAAGRATYDGARAAGCLAFLSTASCEVLEAFMQGQVPQADCQAAIAGELAELETCYSHESCASGLCGSSMTGLPSAPPTSCPSACLTPVPAGAACEFGLPCAAGTYCAVLAATPTCEPVSQLEGSCLNDNWCAPGLFCDMVTYTSGRCHTRATSGACEGDSECAVGYRCSGATCVPWLAAGETCTQGENACGPGLWCGSGGTCVDGPSLGGACGNVNGEDRPCIGGWCDANAGVTCASWLTPGDSCVLSSQCAPTDYCDMAGSSQCTTACAEP